MACDFGAVAAAAAAAAELDLASPSLAEKPCDTESAAGEASDLETAASVLDGSPSCSCSDDGAESQGCLTRGRAGSCSSISSGSSSAGEGAAGASEDGIATLDICGSVDGLADVAFVPQVGNTDKDGLDFQEALTELLEVSTATSFDRACATTHLVGTAVQLLLDERTRQEEEGDPQSRRGEVDDVIAYAELEAEASALNMAALASELLPHADAATTEGSPAADAQDGGAPSAVARAVAGAAQLRRAADALPEDEVGAALHTYAEAVAEETALGMASLALLLASELGPAADDGAGASAAP